MIVVAGSQKFRVRDMRGIASLKGLMFDSLNDDGALISGNSIWMPFVKQDLFLYFLSSEFVLTSFQRAVPINIFRPSTWKLYSDSRAAYCLELKRPVRHARSGMRFRVK